MILGRQYGSLIKLDNGHILSTCADVENTPNVTNQSEIYNPTSRTWTRTGDLNVSRTYCGITKLRDGRVILAGGYDWSVSWSEKLNSIEVYDPASGTWSLLSLNLTHKKADKPQIIDLLDGRVIVAGGLSDLGQEQVDIITDLYQKVNLVPSGGNGDYRYTILNGPGRIEGDIFYVGVAGSTIIRIQDTSGRELEVTFTILP